MIKIKLQVSNKHLLGAFVVILLLVIIGNAESYGSGNPAVMGLTWDEIDDIPAGFADNVDDDTLSQISCENYQVLKYQGGSLVCDNDKYQPTSYPYRVYELHKECDRAFNGKPDYSDSELSRELVYSSYCYPWLWTSTVPPGCVLITSYSVREPECSGTTRICPTRTKYLYRCTNTFVGYFINSVGYYT